MRPPAADTVALACAVPDLQSLRDLLEQCRLDELAHRDDAAARWDGRGSWLLKTWQNLVGRGSEAAVALCRHL
jgi:ubiquinone biosynthesis monooxygenase Coq7